MASSNTASPPPPPTTNSTTAPIPAPKRSKSTDLKSPPTTNTTPGAPIYITIGPQCAGKTTLLTKLEVTDVTIDDQEGVYVKIPTSFFLTNYPPPSPPPQCKESSTLNATKDNFLERRILGRSLSHRIYDESNNEMRFALQRLHNILDADTFETCILQNKTMELEELMQQEENAKIEEERILKEEEEGRKLEAKLKNEGNKENEDGWTTIQTPKRPFRTNSNNNHLRKKRQMEIQKLKLEISTLQSLISTVESILSSSFILPSEVDLFVQEAIFRPRFPNCNTSALDAAIDTLNNYELKDKSLAWGNTNTRPREYKSALEAAESLHRPVHFIMYDSASLLENEELMLQKVEIQTLVQRNVERLINSGKYVPCKAILDATLRCENLKEIVGKELENLYPFENKNDDGGDVVTYGENENGEKTYTKLQLDVALAKLANFEMNEGTRCVVHVPPPTRERDSRGRGDAGGRGRGGYNNNGERRCNNDRGGRGRQNGGRYNRNSNGGRYNSNGNGGRGGRGNGGGGGGRYSSSSNNNGGGRYNDNGRRYENGNEGRYENGGRSNGGQRRYNDEKRRYDDSRGGNGGGGRNTGNGGRQRHNNGGGRQRFEGNNGRYGGNHGGSNGGRGGKTYNQNNGNKWGGSSRGDERGNQSGQKQ